MLRTLNKTNRNKETKQIFVSVDACPFVFGHVRSSPDISYLSSYHPRLYFKYIHISKYPHRLILISRSYLGSIALISNEFCLNTYIRLYSFQSSNYQKRFWIYIIHYKTLIGYLVIKNLTSSSRYHRINKMYVLYMDKIKNLQQTIKTLLKTEKVNLILEPTLCWSNDKSPRWRYWFRRPL